MADGSPPLAPCSSYRHHLKLDTKKVNIGTIIHIVLLKYKSGINYSTTTTTATTVILSSTTASTTKTTTTTTTTTTTNLLIDIL